ncbi:NAD(P)H-dependent oxidoreductase [Flavobacterium sp. ALD4]|uniref:NAD(P)H-dependent oxidoreductase n=1 Tax=Flavobacterium sp. ALD4 TaxID=2058314 RepID=UPI000C335829|nr:NAD(P)H-dependent oxidoreductase [Flavobacterium sp. ALD4]PKH68856.1 NAD(P)H-dependent oxidoreductase [Flavobacterium sp. ALD4]
MNTFLENQNWRYATKKFDATKTITDEDLNTIKEAIRLSSSSFGLQPYKIFIIENAELRAQIKDVAWGQAQVIDASHLLVFASKVNIGDEEVDDYVKNTSITREASIESLGGYANFIKSYIKPLTEDDKNVWTSKQTYLAMGNLLNVAAELKIDVSPMEGFVPEKVNELLGLEKLGYTASLLAPLGYRHDEDATQHYKKVRKSQEDLFITL